MPAKHETWMPLYIADYLGDTLHLQAEQHGAYLLLLMAAWKRGGHVPGDPEELAGIARVPLERWQSHTSAKVLPFFRHDGAIYWHDRVLAELESARTNVAQKAKAGAAGAAARWQKDGKRMADAMPSQSQTDAPSPSPSPITFPEGKVKRKAVESVDADVLEGLGVDRQVADEFLALRRRKRSLLTQIALDGIEAEAKRAGWTLDKALRECIARGWQGFKAEWVQQRQQGMNARDAERQRVIDGLTGRSGHAAREIIDV